MAPSRIPAAAVLVSVVLLAITTTPRAASAQEVGPALTNELRKENALTITLDGLLRFLATYKDNDVAEAMVVKLIQIHGLGFRPNAEDLAKLKEASASPLLLQTIDAAKKPLPATPKIGHLVITCQPVDCEISLNGVSVGPTNRNLSPNITVAEGPATVAVTRTDYDSDPVKQQILIRDGETSRLDFTLKPSRNALVRAGEVLFQQMLDSLGATSEVAPAVLQGNGTLYLLGSDGRWDAWSVAARLQGSNCTIEVSRLHQRYQITCVGGGYIWKKAPKPKEAQELENAIRLIVEGQLSRRIDHLRDPRFTMATPDLALNMDGSYIFRAEGADETFAVTLDAALHPSEIRLESPSLTGASRVLYSEYVPLGGVSYPKVTQVISADGTQGVSANFDLLRITR